MRRKIHVLFAIVYCISIYCKTAESGECRAALGMEAGRIPDHAITASSSYEAKSVGPQNARIRQEKNGGAWCPKAQISSEVREYLEVDLVKNHLITWTETQGRFGNGQGQEYAEAFLIEYWRDSLDQWMVYKDSRGEKVLTGNSNTYLVVRQRLELPFVASRVRFIPYSEHPRTVCMRVELYGCPWEHKHQKISHPVLETLKGTDNAWLIDLLYACNTGDIQTFENIRPQWSKIADLAAQELKLRQKFSLLCLMEMTFKRPTHDRQLTFSEIAKETRLPEDEIELFVMKALAQELVKGLLIK